MVKFPHPPSFVLVSDIAAPPSSHLERRLDRVLVLAQITRPLGCLHLQGGHVPRTRTTARGKENLSVTYHAPHARGIMVLSALSRRHSLNLGYHILCQTLLFSDI